MRLAVFDRIERKLVFVVQVGGDHMHHAVVARAGGDIRCAVDRDREHEAVVVIGMFADQIDATRG
jgi:hypothetical protein